MGATSFYILAISIPCKVSYIFLRWRQNIQLIDSCYHIHTCYIYPLYLNENNTFRWQYLIDHINSRYCFVSATMKRVRYNEISSNNNTPYIILVWHTVLKRNSLLNFTILCTEKCPVCLLKCNSIHI